jgi:hypothetical protein
MPSHHTNSPGLWRQWESMSTLEIGHEVYGMNDWYSDGAMAESCIAPFVAVAPKPAASHTSKPRRFP